MPRPEDVVADEPLRTLLVGIAGAAGGALGLVSGRAIKDIDRIFAPLIFSRGGAAWRGDPVSGYVPKY